MANVTFCVTFLFLSRIGFLSHNFGYRYARRLNKGSKDADFSLVSKKNLSQKWLVGLATRARQSWPKIRKHPHLRRSHREPQTQNWKKLLFFSTETKRLPESIEGLNSSLALAAGDLWPKSAGHRSGRRGRWRVLKRHINLCSHSHFILFLKKYENILLPGISRSALNLVSINVEI